jgi:hypothetical protein
MNLTMKWTTAISTMAAGFVAALLITAPVDAKDRTCAQRNDDCHKRCMASYKDVDAEIRCGVRTCNHQFDQCVMGQRSTAERTPRGPTGPAGPREPRPPKEPKVPRGPKGGVVVR